jgi:glycine cleavage system H protein
MANRPSDCRYTKTHEWIRLEGTTAVVGITDFAVEHLGELVFVDLPAKGKKLGKGETLAEVESVKAVGEVYAPIAGEVAETNGGLANDQTPLAKDPFKTGWLAKLKVPAGTKLDGFMDVAAYQKHLDAGGQ